MRETFNLTYVSSGSPEKRTRSQASQENVFLPSDRFFVSFILSEPRAVRKIRLPSIATSGSPSSPPFPPHSTSPPRCRSATGSKGVLVAGGREGGRERTDPQWQCGRPVVRLPVFAMVSRGPHTYVRARTIRTHTSTCTYR